VPSSSGPTSSLAPASSSRCGLRVPSPWRCCAPAPRWSVTSSGRTSPNRRGRTWPAFLGDEASAHYRVLERDIYEGVVEEGLDRVLLDLPEPWRVGGSRRARPCSGRDSCGAYLPSINQNSRAAPASPRQAGSVWPRPSEVAQRTWHIEGRSVRPDQRMVAHTGFIITNGGLLAPPGARRSLPLMRPTSLPRPAP